VGHSEFACETGQTYRNGS